MAFPYHNTTNAKARPSRTARIGTTEARLTLPKNRNPRTERDNANRLRQDKIGTIS